MKETMKIWKSDDLDKILKIEKSVLSQASDYFLDVAIEQGREDWEEWHENQTRFFSIWFERDRYSSRNPLNVILPHIDKLIILFYKYCPTDERGYTSMYRDTPRFWSDEIGFKAMIDAENAHRAKIESVLTIEKIREYAEGFSSSTILGSGAKPGISLLMQYLAHVLPGEQFKVSAMSFHNTAYRDLPPHLDVLDENGKLLFFINLEGEVLGNIYALMRALGLESVKTTKFIGRKILPVQAYQVIAECALLQTRR